MVEGDIVHSARVVEVTPEFTTVEIESRSACGTCHAAAFCGLSGSSVRAVQIPTSSAPGHFPGEEVNLVLRKTMGYKAVWLSYILPLAVLLVVLMPMTALGAGELLSALSALAAVALYYVVLYLFRNRLKNEYTFYIKDK